VTSMFQGSGCPNTNDPSQLIGPWCQTNADSCFDSTSQPSSAPSLDPGPPTINCINDDSFRLDGNKKKDCAWVAKKYTNNRCMRTDEASNQLVKFFCPLVCKEECIFVRYCSEDDQEFRLNNNPKKDCDWVASKAHKRCRKKDKNTKEQVSESCVSACNLRCLCQDSRKAFISNDLPKRCVNVIEGNQNQCSKMATARNDKTVVKSVAEFCPKKCGICYQTEGNTTQQDQGQYIFT